MKFILVITGGALGALLRYIISENLQGYKVWQIPLATLAVNIVASFIFGIIYSYLENKYTMIGNENIKLLITTGFCGSLSTFSTFAFESFELLKNGGGLFPMLSYAIISFVLCILAIYFGINMAKLI